MVHRAVLERSGDRHLVRFEPECEVSTRKPMAYNLVTRTSFLHCGAGSNLSGDSDFQRRLAVSWVNGECQVYRAVGVTLLDEARFLDLSHFSPHKIYSALVPVTFATDRGTTIVVISRRHRERDLVVLVPSRSDNPPVAIVKEPGDRYTTATSPYLPALFSSSYAGLPKPPVSSRVVPALTFSVRSPSDAASRVSFVGSGSEEDSPVSPSEG